MVDTSETVETVETTESLEKRETKKADEQTIIGKILGWFFGIIFCIFIFSVFDKEIGAFGFGLTVIGVLLLPPVNMNLRRKYQNFVRLHHGEKYSLNIINLGYASMKFVFALVLLIVLSSFVADDTNSTNNSSSNSKQPANVSQNQAQKQQETKPEPKVSLEFRNALIKAETYSQTMHMSKRGIYDQLVSDYGEQFPADAAQYAVNNVKADFKLNALEKAKTYQSQMSMSKKAIYDQLISEYGEKFTPQEAQYAIDHLND